MANGSLLLLIDPQYDFHDVPLDRRVKAIVDGNEILIAPSLPVKGSYGDAERLSVFIRSNAAAIDDVIVTMDSHSVFDIAHPLYWKDANGNHPAEFTSISHRDIVDGTWLPSLPELKQQCLRYAKTLAEDEKESLMIWPPHCISGQVGQTIVDPIMSALNYWSSVGLKAFSVISKGQNSHTEHYGGLCAEVELENSPDTSLNVSLLRKICSFERIYIAGQALSHCVGATISQIIENGDADIARRLFVLSDATSPVAGFEQKADAMVSRFKQMGVNFADSANVKL